MDAEKLAEHIVKEIFDIGIEGGYRPHRMEYKVGDYPKVEWGVGGLNEAAMRKYVSAAIKSFRE